MGHAPPVAAGGVTREGERRLDAQIVAFRHPARNESLCAICHGRDCACADYETIAPAVAAFVDAENSRAWRDARRAAARARGRAVLAELRSFVVARIEAERTARSTAT